MPLLFFFNFLYYTDPGKSIATALQRDGQGGGEGQSISLQNLQANAAVVKEFQLELPNHDCFSTVIHTVVGTVIHTVVPTVVSTVVGTVVLLLLILDLFCQFVFISDNILWL